jgi:hypothetical protein
MPFVYSIDTNFKQYRYLRFWDIWDVFKPGNSKNLGVYGRIFKRKLKK